MDNNEKELFRNCISDDLLYIREIKSVCIDNRTVNFLQSACYPALCRMLIVVSVSSIDHFLNYSEDDYSEAGSPYNNALRNLISSPRENAYDSKERYFELLEGKVESFYRFSTTKKMKIDKPSIRNFLAIRMIRNAIVHSSWRNRQIRCESKREIECISKLEYISGTGLTSDLMKLNEAHWKLISSIEQTFLTFLNLNPILENYSNRPKK